MRTYLLLLSWLLLASGVLCAEEPEPTAPNLETLCAQLGHDSFDVREAAHRKLLQLGQAVKPKLQALSETSNDAEVVWRARTILHEISERERLRELFGHDDGTLGEQELTEAKEVAVRLEQGGVQHRNSVYEEIGPAKLPRVVEAMRAWMRRNPQDANVAYNLAYTLFWMERQAEAAAMFLYTETIAPTELRAFNDAGIALELDSRYSEAIAQYEKTIKHFPNFSHPVCGLTSLQILMGDRKRALELWQSTKDMYTLGDAGTNFEAVLARLLADNGKLAEAEEHFKAAFQKQGEELYAYEERYDMLWDHGRFEDLKRLLSQALEALPNNSSITMLQAHYAAMTGDAAGAFQLLDKVIAQRGDTVTQRSYKASFLISAKEYGQAEPIIKQLLQQHPRDGYILSLATTWARETKHWREAVEYATAGANLRPRVPYAHADLAAIYASADDPQIRNLQRARDLAKVVEQLMADSYYYGTAKTIRAELNKELSYVYEAEGKRAEALARHQEYAALFPWDKDAQERLAKLKAAAAGPEMLPPKP